LAPQSEEPQTTCEEQLEEQKIAPEPGSDAAAERTLEKKSSIPKLPKTDALKRGITRSASIYLVNLIP
jgi:hypothetical protein